MAFLITAQQFDPKQNEFVMVEIADKAGGSRFEYRFEVMREIEEEGYVFHVADSGGDQSPKLLRIVTAGGQKFLRCDGEVSAGDFLCVPEI